MEETRIPPTRRSWGLRNLDLLMVTAGAPVAVLTEAPLAGYAIGAAAWVLLRGFGLAVDRRARVMSHMAEQVALRLSYRLVRAALLTGAAVLALKTGGTGDGLAALTVIIAAFTIRVPLSFLEAQAAGWASASGPRSS